MNKLEKIALSTGSKIGKPYIYTTFFPLPIDKYITFHSDDTDSSKNYSYIQDVINILIPILLKHDIRLVQVGNATDRSFANCVSVKGSASPNQVAYIIHKSLLHFGADGFATHLAGGFDIPLVSIIPNNYINCDKPYFGSPEKQIIFGSYERTESKKPSFANDENPKTINLIKPEEIAAAILKLLKIDYTIPFESVYFGKKYSSYIIQETVPNYKNILFNPELLVEIRADHPSYNEESFIFQLANFKKAVVLMDKPINLNIIRQFKQNIQMLVFIVTEKDNTDFLVQMESLGCKILLISYMSQAEIDKQKIKYYQFGIINKIDAPTEETITKLKLDIDNLYYHSAKITASNEKFYGSQAAADIDVPIQNTDEYQKVIDSPAFWKELEFYTIIKKK